jgi:NhaA family Na+:H+ antiporter
MPYGSSWRQLYGVAVLTGIGFTMSLFIDSLAFQTNEMIYENADKLAVLAGSFLSGIIGYLILRRTQSN